MARSRILAAAKVILYINGKPFAPVTSFRWDSNTMPREIIGLDSGEPYELAPARAKLTGQLGLFRLGGDGGLEGLGISQSYEDLPREKYFSLALVDRETDTTIFRADKCWLINQSWDVPSKGLITGSATFTAFDWRNETTTAA